MLKNKCLIVTCYSIILHVARVHVNTRVEKLLFSLVKNNNNNNNLKKKTINKLYKL